MKNKVLNFMANLPIYPALLFHNISTVFFNFSKALHMRFNTELGKALRDLHNILKEMNNLNKDIPKNSKTIDNKISKLATIIKGDSNATSHNS